MTHARRRPEGRSARVELRAGRHQAPLERDYQTILNAPPSELMSFLGDSASLGAWFPDIKRTSRSEGLTQVDTPFGELVGVETWLEDNQAGIFETADLAFYGFVTIKTILTNTPPGLGTEVWVHVEAEPSTINRVVVDWADQGIVRGLHHMSQELNR